MLKLNDAELMLDMVLKNVEYGVKKVDKNGCMVWTKVL